MKYFRIIIGFEIALTILSDIVQSAVPVLEQYIGRWPNTTIQGLLALFSGLLASYLCVQRRKHQQKKKKRREKKGAGHALLTMLSNRVQSSVSSLEQYIGRWPKTTIHGCFCLFSGLLASCFYQNKGRKIGEFSKIK